MKKGFTLIELLAVIAILAVIFLIAIPKLVDVVNDARNSVYFSNEKALEKSARIYLASNPSLIPAEGGKIVIPLADLITAEVIKEVVDPKTGSSCNAFVEVYKNMWSRIEYNAFIECGTNYVTPGFNGLKTSFYYAFGDGATDMFHGIATNSDSYIMVGVSDSNNGIMSSKNNGSYDAIISRYDKLGNRIWLSNFGGSFYDRFYDVDTLSDGYIAVGHSDSTDFDMSTLSKGNNDAIIVKYDFNGNLVWKKIYGGTNTDMFRAVRVVSDGILAVGYSDSTNSDLSGLNKGGTDGIVVKYDFDGNIIWKKNYGGTSTDYFYDVELDGTKIVLVGSTASNTGDYVGLLKGGTDASFIRINSDNSFDMARVFGGNGTEYAYGVSVLSSGYALVGSTTSTTLDFASYPSKGGTDAYIAFYDKSGNVSWASRFGGTSTDIYNRVTASGTNIYVGGYSSSTNVDMTISKGADDGVLITYDATSAILNSRSIGGPSYDYVNDLLIDGTEIVLTGSTTSSTVDMVGISPNAEDAYLLKLNSAYARVYASAIANSTGIDYYYGVSPLFDGFLASGYTNSKSGYMKNYMGSYDASLTKFDFDGKIVWHKLYGGTGTDYFYYMCPYMSGALVAGSTSSNNVDIITGNKGGQDAIIAYIDGEGNVVWKTNFGGTSTDFFQGVNMSADGFVASGYSSSTTNDLVGQNKGGQDAIIAAYDVDKNLIFGKTFGGTGTDEFMDSIRVPGGYVAVGRTTSNTNDVLGLNKGSYDGVIAKFSDNGTLLWVDTFGGTGSDFYRDVVYLNGYIYVVGYSPSTDVDMNGINKGGTDSVIVKYSDAGVREQVGIFGGAGTEYFYSITIDNGELLVGGSSSSTNLDLLGVTNYGGTDMLAVKYDQNLNVTYKKMFGAHSTDVALGISPVRDGVVLAGYTYSYYTNFAKMGTGYLDYATAGFKY